MTVDTPLQKKNLVVIGFGAVGQAWLKKLRAVISRGLLECVGAVHFWAPEIKEFKQDGVFTFHPLLETAPEGFNRGNLEAILDAMSLKEGDILMELATRIDTGDLWKAVKRRGAHFLNSG
eukprot:GDKI01048957.1.p1 GENE.GDKI01048957.1~~GDKI01048957.1.p1  ORF type:complete len:120 (-),score=45.61 GDKI01048957.1:20-379(-)